MRITFILLLSCFLQMGISQDAYHLDLVQYLNENYEVENPEFSIADTEQGVISSMSIYGNSSSSVTDASNLGFSKISTLNVPNALNNQWDTGYNTRNKVAVEEGDIVVLAFWAKRNSPSSELFFFAEDANNFDKEFYFSFGLTPDWTRYFMAFEATKDYSANRMSIGFHLGSIAQNFDIAGFTMLNYKDNYDLFDLPSSFENGFYGGSSPDADWREPAAARIEELRKSDLSVRVVNENGDGIEGVEINVEMEEHLFGFGSAFVTCRFPGNNCFDATYVEKVGNLDGKGHGFNVGVTENAVKWDGWEEEWIGTPTQTVNAIEYLHNNGVTMRGHTLIWPGFNNLPEDIQQNQNDLAYIRQRIEERIQTMINHPVLKDIIREWDVLNEITVNRDLEFAFKDDPNFETGRELYQEIFERIRELDPELKLYMNEYVVLSGGGSGTNVINRYKTFLTEINESSQPMDGIGFQCHIGSNPTSIYKLQEVFDEFYATYNVPIKITEYDVNELVNDEDAGKYLNDFLTMVFSHEAVNAFIMWGFWDGNHWKDNAPMFAEDWTLKPAGQVFIDKVFNEWWTNETVQSDDDGFATIRAFKGVHKITATKDGQTRVAQVSLDQDGSVQLVLEGVSNTNDVSDADFILSPNPATNGYFMISFPEELGTVDISVLSMDGRRVGIMNNIKPNVKTDLDLPTGMYLMNITSKSGTLTKKVIVE